MRITVGPLEALGSPPRLTFEPGEPKSGKSGEALNSVRDEVVIPATCYPGARFCPVCTSVLP
jgi:hypothetical protein